MKKIVYIIPGYSESKSNNPAYNEIAGYFRKQGIKPIIVDIDWKYKTMTDYVSEFKEIYKRQAKGETTYFLGFSYGAMIALISSAELKPRAQILCSLSPFFKEDIPHMRGWWKVLVGKRRIVDSKKISFDSLAKKILSKTILLAGDKEGEEVMRRARDAKKKIKNSRLVIISGVKHRIGQEEYLAQVKKEISKL